MPILVEDMVTAEKFAHVSNRARRLAQTFWPGPLTMILEAREAVPTILVPDGRVGLRSPNHAICLNLLRLCSGALVGTSANLTGRPPGSTAEEVFQQIGDQVDMILDGGKAPLAVASTVVDLTQPKLTILREGPLGREELLRSLRRTTPR
jgi:L-threonylcarbamoyladenylate synthase